MDEIEDETIDLVITSPPYPMIELWDSIFSNFNEHIKLSLKKENGKKTFNLMHIELNKVWNEVKRVLKSGGICCINVGDATRKMGKTFQLYSNHVEITKFYLNNGFIQLPSIIWRKPTNSPTKFLGSGMVPPNAYITLEHEHILIFRKGKSKVKFKPQFKPRYNSAYFWEERNKWFSDIWTDIQGISQNIENWDEQYSNMRERSAAFSFKIPYRLINMFSIHGDTILDPFWGTGTTSLAAMVLARNSVGYEINSEFMDVFMNRMKEIKSLSKKIEKYRQKENSFIVKHSIFQP
ncbi:MAG: site-specific DNA-methyltransferase [Candidatus Lokiarchaeota archaeon]